MNAANSSEPTQKKRIAVIPGDGIGIDVTAEATKVLRAVAAAAGRTIELVDFDWGADRYLKDGTTLPDGAEDMLRREFDSVFVGALGDPRVPSMKHAADILLGLRFKLDLYVNSRPVVLLDKRLTPLRDRDEKDLHFIVFRENTEGLYVGMGGIFKKGTPDELATQEDINTRKGVERIIRYAYEYARKHKLSKVCMSDKSNALRFGHDLWQRVFAEVQKEYPEIESSHWYVDALTMQMVKNPAQFQVIVTCNMFGDIISDLGAQLVGGLGLAPSGNIHPGRLSMFEPVHGSAPKYAGKNVSNPMAAIQTVAIMLDHLGWMAEADVVNDAVRAAVHEGKTTKDLGGALGTREVGDWLAEYVSKKGVVRKPEPQGRG
ncbi:MAG: 3-isopropylmalate dehydrogenase [Acidobacteria bacterium]|nr:3-isopropylmalate dehydrogenase [Acidobacteriota bacterium]MBI3664174.1 3-isopropylmalate dehydrogenase [Acidobacteriota bacterium]